MDEAYLEQLLLQQQEDLYLEEQDIINQKYISYNNPIYSEEYIKTNIDNIDLIEMLLFRDLSEFLISQCIHTIKDGSLGKDHQRFSEDFINKFPNKMDWDYISVWYNLSDDFVLKNIDKLNIEFLLRYNSKLSENIKTYIKMFI